MTSMPAWPLRPRTDTAWNQRRARRRHHLWEALRHCASVRHSPSRAPRPPPGPGALNRCKVPRGHSGRARGGGSSCAVIRSGTKACPPVLGQVNTRFVMEMSAGQPEQMIRGFGKRRPRPWAGEGSGAGGGDPSSAPGPPAEHATRPFSCKSAHAFATCCRPEASTRRPRARGGGVSPVRGTPTTKRNKPTTWGWDVPSCPRHGRRPHSKGKVI